MSKKMQGIISKDMKILHRLSKNSAVESWDNATEDRDVEEKSGQDECKAWYLF